MLKILASDIADSAPTELVLLDGKNRPTPLLLGLAALEITFDILVAYTAYRLMKR